VHKGLRSILRLTDSGILALSIIVLVELLGLDRALSFPLTVTLYGLAVCIPFAGLQAFLLSLEAEPGLIKHSLGSWGHLFLTVGAVLPFYIGILYMFSALSLGASILFAIASSIPYSLFYLMGLSERRRYFVAAGVFLVFLVANAVFLGMGYVLHQENFFYTFLHWLS
jgi:hypothetical protein